MGVKFWNVTPWEWLNDEANVIFFLSLTFQGTNTIELPDVSRVSPVGFSTVVSLPSAGQNGSAVRINGGSLIEQDSLSSNSKDGDNGNNHHSQDGRGNHLMSHYINFLLLAIIINKLEPFPNAALNFLIKWTGWMCVKGRTFPSYFAHTIINEPCRHGFNDVQLWAGNMNSLMSVI